MLRKFMIAAAFSVSTAFAGLAADIPQRGEAPAPAPIMTLHNWTGFFVGVHAGYQSGKVVSSCPAGCQRMPNLNNVFGGIQAGYNHQLPNNVVLGVWATLPLVGGKTTNTATFPGVVITGSVRWAFAAGARIGYAFDRVLPFVHAGFVIGGGRAGSNFVGGFSNSTHTGYTVGAGIEYALSNNWSATLRYAYASLSKERYTVFPASEKHGFNTHTFAIGLNYTFKSTPASVVAKY